MVDLVVGLGAANRSDRRRVAVRYAIALAAVGVAVAGRILLNPLLQDEAPFLLLVPAVLAASALGGLGPGLLATGLSVVSGLFFFAEFPSLTSAQLGSTAVFALVGCGLAWCGGQVVRARSAAAETTRDLLARTEDLRSREAHLKSILETIPDAMIVIDDAGLIQSFSSAAERLFGYRASEVLGENVKL